MNRSSAVILRLADVRDAVISLPPRAAWTRCALIYLAFLVCALPIGIASGLLHAGAAPLTPGSAAIAICIILLHPAFTEEVIFRALLLPRRAAAIAPARLAAIVIGALTLYVAAHPLNAWLFWPAALAVFANPWYLTLAALLGAACTAAYLVSGSIWPSVVIHWTTVSLWLFLLGGQELLAGRR